MESQSTSSKKLFGLLSRNLKQNKETLAQLASFPEMNPNPVVEVDLSGQVNYANPSAKQIFPDLQTTGVRHPWLEGLEEVVQMLKDQHKVSIVRELKINDTWYEQSIYVAENQRLRIYGLDISERKQAEKALQIALQESTQRQAEISALLEGARAVLEYHEFKESARSIFNSCKILIGATAGYVALLSKDGAENEVLFLDSGGLPCTVDPFLPMPIRGLREEAYRTGKAVFHNDFLNTEYVKLMPEGHVRLDHVLFAPLIIKGTVTGLLGLANKQGGFTDEDARMALAFAELAAIALSNSRSLEALEHNEEHFRSVVQTANDSIISIDSSGRIIYWNKAAEALFGYSSDKMLGQSLTFIIPERYRERHQQALQQVSVGHPMNRAEKIVEMSGLRRDRSEFPLELSLAKWETAEGIFFTGIIRDITERKRAEESLQKSRDELEIKVRDRTAELANSNQALQIEVEERKHVEEALRQSEIKYRTVADNTYDWEWWRDPKGNFIYVSPSCKRITHREAEEFIKDPDLLHKIIHPDDRSSFVRHQIDVEEKHAPDEIEFRILRPDGSFRWLAHVCQPVFDKQGHFLGPRGSNRDITERKIVEEALKESEEKLRHLSSQLLSAEENERKRIAREIHDGIGQSLTAIKFRVENMIQEMDGKKEKTSVNPLETIVPIIKQSIEESRRIQMDLRPSILDDLGILATLNWFCREFQNTFSRIDIKKEIDIEESDVPDALKTTIYRILQEAANNISKHSQANLAHLSLRKTEGNIELIIQDNGQGFNLNEALSTDPLRRGLGLTSMKERTELSGGTFSIESIMGEGTTIRAKWPS